MTTEVPRQNFRILRPPLDWVLTMAVTRQKRKKKRKIRKIVVYLSCSRVPGTCHVPKICKIVAYLNCAHAKLQNPTTTLYFNNGSDKKKGGKEKKKICKIVAYLSCSAHRSDQLLLRLLGSSLCTLETLDTSGNLMAHMSAESPSNITNSTSKVISEVSESQINF